ncbi:unnamed protein product [Ilex paraguariensis]|uniref:porphobilinogen synthase n=1 Tax=Ilex paraguariensis TaxID=185542 RepID=A0ABC8RLM1_9AQUA
MNPANYREALVEVHEDESEGADILLVGITFQVNLITCLVVEPSILLKFTLIVSQVKPGLPYLDIIRLLQDNSPLPIAAYQAPILGITSVHSENDLWRKHLCQENTQ